MAKQGKQQIKPKHNKATQNTKNKETIRNKTITKQSAIYKQI